MSTIDRERDYRSLTAALDFVFEKRFLGIYTSMPGIVEAYDPTTKRARVRGAIRITKTDEDGNIVGSETRRPIVNVPVVWPNIGGLLIQARVRPGDAVMLHFSMRGLAEFNRTHAEADPTLSSLLSENDAVAVPGFGALTIDADTITMTARRIDMEQA